MLYHKPYDFRDAAAFELTMTGEMVGGGYKSRAITPIIATIRTLSNFSIPAFDRNTTCYLTPSKAFHQAFRLV